MIYDTAGVQDFGTMMVDWCKPVFESRATGDSAWRQPVEAAETAHIRSTLVIASFKWLDTIYGLVEAARPDDAIDILFESVDAITDKQCDLLLRSVDLQRLDAALLVSLLSITLDRKDGLTQRGQVVQRVEARLRDLAPDRLDGLMEGLR